MKRVGLRLFPLLILCLSWLTLTGSAMATDLYFKSVNFNVQKAPDGTVGVGALVNSSYTIVNTGGTLFTTVVVQAFLCSQKLASTCKAQSFSVTRHTIQSGQLNSRGTYFKYGIGARIGFPVDITPGVKYVRLVLDAYGKVRETNEKNNEAWFAVTVDGKADLRLSLLAATPNRFSAGQDVTLTFDVHNSGRVRAPNAKIAFYISKDSIFSATADTKLGEVIKSYNVMATYPTGAVRSTLKVKIPANWLGTGRNYLFAVADYDKKIPESNENNNLRSAAVTLNDSRPDLTVRLSRPSILPSGGGAGATIHVSFQVSNTGIQKAGAFVVKFYLNSTTGALLSTASVTGVDPGKVFYGRTSATLPNTLRGGQNQVVAVVDADKKVSEKNESNNLGYYGFLITPKVDLKIKSLVLSPTSAYRSGKVKISFVVENAGNVVFNSVRVLLYYSNDNRRDGRDTILYNRIIGVLNARSSTNVNSFTFTVPSNAAYGTRYVIAYVASSGTEPNSSNNQMVAPLVIQSKQADLSPSGIIGLTKVKAGVATNITVSLINKGLATATHVLRVYYSKDATLQSTDPQVGASTIVNHAPGAVIKRSLPITIPTSATAGVGYLFSVVDADKKVAESNENNNFVFNKVTILVDKDKDGVFNDLDCNDNNKAIKPGAKELCDKVDNNCDGKVDEGCSCKNGDKQACGTDTGECSKGTQTCDINGKWGSCTGGKQPVKELCDGKDNDCDGKTDEDFTNLGKTCAVGVGACRRTGKYVCRSGGVKCSAIPGAKAVETCNGKDDDCDGKTDESLQRKCYNGPSGSDGKGLCKSGSQVCASGQWGACVGEVKPGKEVCDGKDNNCDGKVDNDPSCNKTEPSPEPTTDGGPGDTVPEQPSGTCGGTTCRANEFCRKGQCVAVCDCTKCPRGDTCIDGRCVQDPCDGVTCKNAICVDGKCVSDDPCKDVQCPGGFECRKGQCFKTSCGSTEPGTEPQQEPTTDAGTEPVSDAKPDNGGSEPTTDAGNTDKGTPEAAKESGGSEKTAGDSAGTDNDPGPTGCSCAVSSSSSNGLGLLLLLGLVFWWRRRRIQTQSVL